MHFTKRTMRWIFASSAIACTAITFRKSNISSPILVPLLDEWVKDFKFKKFILNFGGLNYLFRMADTYEDPKGLLKLIAVLSKDGQEVWIRNASTGLNAINTLVERSDMKNRNSAVDELYECLVKMEDMDIVMVDPLENIENIVQYMQEKDRCPEEVQFLMTCLEINCRQYLLREVNKDSRLPCYRAEMDQRFRTFRRMEDESIYGLVNCVLKFAEMYPSNALPLKCAKTLEYALYLGTKRKAISDKSKNRILAQLSIWIQSDDLQVAAKSVQMIGMVCQLKDPWKIHSIMPNLLKLARRVHGIEKRKENEFDMMLSNMKKDIANIVAAQAIVNKNDVQHGYRLDDHLKSTVEIQSEHLWKSTVDIMDLPIGEAMDIEGTFTYGWVDLLAEWSIKDQSTGLQHISIKALSNMALYGQHGQSVLQSWLVHLLRFIRSNNPSEEILRAVSSVESAAMLQPAYAPGIFRGQVDKNVLVEGCNALAVLSQKHYDELLWCGGIQLVTLLSQIENPTDNLQSACYRVIAALSGASCKLKNDIKNGNATSIPTDIRAYMEKIHFGRKMLNSIMHGTGNKCMNCISNALRAKLNMDSFRDSSQPCDAYYVDGLHITKMPQAPKADIVFIHGLRGDPFMTWRAGMNVEVVNDATHWPSWLQNDLSDAGIGCRVFSLGYDAGMSTWSSVWPSLSLPSRAVDMLKAIKAAKIGQDGRPVIFITHSMGGILVKEMLAHITTNLQARQVYDEFLHNVRGIAFMAVPHFGANIKHVNQKHIRQLISAHPATEKLSADEPHLLALNEQFLDLAKAQGINVLSLSEHNKSALGFGIEAIIVPQLSAYPGIGEFHVLNNTDHADICKPLSRDDERYFRIRNFALDAITKKCS